jgi:phosphatidylserine/phosphatidylglycerophosphate/cardiolipin synthase-like enzyme
MAERLEIWARLLQARRGVDVEALIVDKLEREDASLGLDAVVGELGTLGRLSVRRGVASEWFAHMKVLTVDSRAAYVGSANSTIAGLTANFELGDPRRGA